QMKADIDVAFAVRKLVIALECLAQALALLLQAKWHDERVASERSERVALSKSSAMTMSGPLGCEIWTWLSIPPGRTSLPLGIQHFASGSELIAERCDLAVANPDLGRKGIRGSRHRAAADDQIECHGHLHRIDPRTCTRGCSALTKIATSETSSVASPP